MHELSVTEHLLEIALRQARERDAARVTDLYLVVGELSTFVDESVQFYWNSVSEGTPAEAARLHFRRVPASFRCDVCSHVFALGRETFDCSQCGSCSVSIETGDEFSLEAIEIETRKDIFAAEAV